MPTDIPAGPVRTVFVGGTRRGLMTLEALVQDEATLAGVISLEQDAHEQDRCEPAIAALAERRGIPIVQTKWMKDRDYSHLLREEWGADLVVVVGCRILIDSCVYQAPRLGTVAVHDSMLPRYRGFAPLNWAVINGETETGVTLFYLADEMDAGDVIGQKSVAIGPNETAFEVYGRICTATVDLIREQYRGLVTGAAPRISQDHGRATYTCSRTPDDGRVDWHWSTRRVFDLVRALARPYPGAFTFYKGRKLFLWGATPLVDAPTYEGRIPGRVVTVNRDVGYADVLTADGILRLTEVEVDGEGPLPAATVLTSVKARLGVEGH